MLDLDLGWAAGLFEGEGTVTIAVRNSDLTYRLVCTLVNTDEEIIDAFVERFDGWKQPLYGKRPGRQPGWSWTVAGPRAERFLREIEPHVLTKRVRRKLELGLEFRRCQSRRASVWRAPGYKERQRELYLEMKALNRRGTKP